MPKLTINASDLEIRRMRENLAIGFGALDEKRPTAWAQYGYPTEVSFAQLYQAYKRGGAGHGAVHRILDGCWQAIPRIKSPASDDVSPWEKKTAAALASLSAWAKLRDFDRRNMVGHYAGLIYRIADGKALDQPVSGKANVVDLIPVYEDQLKVVRWHQDKADADNYGKPAMYQYRQRDGIGDTATRPVEWADVHPDRVQIFAEGAVGDMFDGVPLLLAGFNALVDLEKISGGSGESFLKNSARTLVFEYDPSAQVTAIGENGEQVSAREAHEEQTRALNRNQDSSIVLQGGKATTLQTSISDPTGPAHLAGNLFAASIRLPYTIVFGQQTGRLASEQDNKDANARYKSRQANELTPMITACIKKLQALGVVDAGEFEVEWPDVAAPSDAQKLSNLKDMVTALKDAFGAGIQGLFTEDELRGVVGYKPKALEPMPGEGA